MISLADEKAALAWLDQLLVAVNGDDPDVILRVTHAAIDFYKQLRPETPDDYEAIRNSLAAIAAAQIRAVCLLELEGKPHPPIETRWPHLFGEETT
jgi:hypothetical protein